MKPRIIVCGLGRTGYKIFTLLRQQGAFVVGITDRPIPSERQEDIVIGDLRSPATLVGAGIRDAHAIVLASGDDAINLATLTQARLLNPRIRIINRLLNHPLGERLDRILPDHVSMSVSSLAAPIFAFAALGNKAIGQLRLFNHTWPIEEVVIESDHPWLGLKLSQLWDNPARMLIYYLSANGEMDLVSGVIGGVSLEVGDRLIIGSRPALQAKRRSALQKFLKVFTNLEQYQRYVGSVVFVSLALLATIFIATATYVFVNYNTSIVDSLYFSVGMITGAGGQEQVAENAPASIKVFTAIMMIVGAGVIGICYALLNDLILGSRFKQFWDVARVPHKHHYIVCGLGGIGIETIRQLQHQGHEVVAIECDPKNRYLHTARLMGVPVIIEDARMPATLKAANIQAAKSIVVATSSDMANVEIGLTGKAITPGISVILRSQEPQFAQSVQEVFGFETVLCPAELATHAFAAAALGGRILGNGMTDDLLWVAIATLITTNHPFCGRKVETAAREGNFVPLYVERGQKTIHSWALLEIWLQTEDILFLTLPASELEQLWRNVPQATSAIGWPELS